MKFLPTLLECADALNAQIDWTHDMLQKGSKIPIYRFDAGIEDKMWHSRCFQRAVITNGWHMKGIPGTGARARALKHCFV